MRLFIAINIPKKERDRIHRSARVLRENGFPVRWVPAELLHLTLRFLGEVRPGSVSSVEEILSGVARTTDPFSIGIGGIGAFPTIRRPRVLWMGVDPSPALRGLYQDLEWALSEQGFGRETRAFHPHFTLGRATADKGAGAFRGLDVLASESICASEATVRKFDLMESHLSSSGPRYEVKSSFLFRGPKSQKGIPGC
ncbi:MAG: RNA 2',3'-cyclic phosphodiesterase [Longimicrobiales bacterium]|nr:RNA 2',3'-cyclic phosphodiesterase [Longimicrobiales bacterium]